MRITTLLHDPKGPGLVLTARCSECDELLKLPRYYDICVGADSIKVDLHCPSCDDTQPLTLTVRSDLQSSSE